MNTIVVDDSEMLMGWQRVITRFEASVAKLDPQPHVLQTGAFEKPSIPFLHKDLRTHDTGDRS
jgi:hypothetical protein